MESRTLIVGMIIGLILRSLLVYSVITIPQSSAYEKQVKTLDDQLTQLQLTTHI